MSPLRAGCGPLRTPSRGGPGVVLLATLLVAGSLGLPASLPGQDVEALGRIYGNRPPDAYYERIERDPDAFRFGRALKGMVRGGAFPVGEGAPAGTAVGGGNAAPAGAPAGGTVRIPVVMGLYADSDSLHPSIRSTVDGADIDREFFDGPNTYYRTLTEFYDENSGGAATVTGDVFDWTAVGLARSEVVGSCSGLGCNDSQVGLYIADILSKLDSAGVDWSRFDADDDGFVDALAVLHPDVGAECGGAGIWSHRFRISGWLSSPFVTSTAGPGGENIRVDDYVIIPAVSCDRNRSFIEIGVLTHELGHAFGLPDLYDTSGQHHGIGAWGLMGSGNWGCDHGNGNPIEPSRPCHMSAWSKAVLGWVAVDTIPAGQEPTATALEPAETGRRVLRVDARDGSGEFYLLENRQPVGFDERIWEPGLAVWQIDPDVIASRGPSNTVNTDPDAMGVRMVQADGEEDLQSATSVGGNRGDRGDVFPGETGTRFFHAGTDPRAFSNDGAPTALTLLEISQESGAIMGFRAMTAFRELVVRREEGGSGGVRVDGGEAVALPAAFRWAPFETHALEPAPGEESAPGVRSGFVEWLDGAPRTREFTIALADTALVARFGTEYALEVELVGGVRDVAPGTVRSTPEGDGGWFPAGTEVQLEAEATTGFAFRRWEGDLTASDANPVAVVVDEPSAIDAEFDLVYGIRDVEPPVRFPAAASQEVVFEAENANEPVRWTLASGGLPPGMTFRSDGTLAGAAMETGSFSLTLTATDALGLEASVGVTVEVETPRLGADALAGPFLLTGSKPSALQRQFLDRSGNGNGRYDLADLRSFVIANPDLPAATRAPAVLRRVIRIPWTDGEGEEEKP